MKTIPSLLLDSYGRPSNSTCHLVRIATKKTGETFGFTTTDADLRIDDGNGLLTYDAYQELRPQNLQEDNTLEVDNTDLVGWFDPSLENKILAGLFNGADITIYRTNYLRPEYGIEVVSHGTVGEIDFSKDAQSKRKIEFRSLKQQLAQTPNALYSLTCRHDFGDDNCGVPFTWQAGTISALGVNPFMQFSVSGIAQPDDWFDLGVVEFVDGPNAGATVEVESWKASGLVVLSFLPPFAATNGVHVRLRRDCGKTATDCKNYSNIENMGAEHLTPVQDQSLMVPGAYIKKQGSL